MRISPHFIWLTAFLVTVLIGHTELRAQYGGRMWPRANCIYPEDVFLHAAKGGRVLDVTKPPFNAKGDGHTDDTAAFIRAYDYVLNKMDEVEWDASGPKSLDCSYIIYIPDGTYLLSNTIIYSGPIRAEKKATGRNKGQWYFERLVRIRFIGQSRRKTILRLKDNCPGFEQGTGRPLLSYGKADFNNRVAYNVLRNVTINTGSGNPGAVGVNFAGANMTGIRNVRICSEDGQGSTGLQIRIPPTMGYHCYLEIVGFDYGISMIPYHVTHNSFEHVSLRGQRKAGIRLVDSTTSIRRLSSLNKCPAIEIVGPGAQAIVIDSRLNEGDENTPAIDLQAGQLFARNIRTTGYQMAVARNGEAVVENDKIDEYVSGAVFTLSEDTFKASLNLVVEEAPGIRRERNLDHWANVDAFGAKGDGETDDTEAVQAAMNSGKSTVYFPRAAYKIAKPIDVPPTVVRVDFLFGAPKARFRVADGGRIRFNDGVHVAVEHASDATLIFDHIGFLNYRNTGAEYMAKLFLNNCTGYGKNPVSARDLRIWARFINTETPGPVNFYCDGSDMWVFGYKVEKGNVNFHVKRGGCLEVLGGVANEHGFDAYPAGDNPIVLCENSKVSYVGCTNGPGQFENIVEEKRGKDTKRLRRDALPKRIRKGGSNDVFVPLYVGDTFTPKTLMPGKQKAPPRVAHAYP